MDLPIAWLIGAGLFLLILGPFLYLVIKRGKAQGHTWFTWWKPRGHSDIGPDTGSQHRPLAVVWIRGGAHDTDEPVIPHRWLVLEPAARVHYLTATVFRSSADFFPTPALIDSGVRRRPLSDTRPISVSAWPSGRSAAAPRLARREPGSLSRQAVHLVTEGGW